MLTRREFGFGLAALSVAGRSFALAEAAGPGLFPGEQMIEAAGFPALIRFIKGQPDKPLVVFLPGTSFLARIAYGYPGGREDDFFAAWLVREGYSFLGVSYPLDNPVYRQVFPAFTLTDWGRQAATAARKVIDAHKLPNRIVVVGWSMGGKPVVTVARAAKALGLDLALFVALDALPPGPDLFPGNAAGLRLGRKGMVDQANTLMPWFQAMLELQNRMNGHTIIPADMLRTTFTGNPPLDIQGENVRFRDGHMVSDSAAAAADSGADDYGAYPPLALIISDGQADYPNVLLCRSNWSRIVGQQLYRTYVYPQRNAVGKLSAQQWSALQSAFATATDGLTAQVNGTHFLFVGRIGAQKAAAAITELLGRSQRLQGEIEALLKGA